MKRFLSVPLAALVLMAGCSGPSDTPESNEASTPSSVTPQDLDSLWSAIADTQAELRLRESELVVDCLEQQGLTTHNVDHMTRRIFSPIPLPSVVMEQGSSYLDLPTEEEATVVGLGVWTDFGDVYGDEDAEAAAEFDSGAADDDNEAAVFGSNRPDIDVSALETAGEGWVELPTEEKVAWEIAYQGPTWAASSKAAGLLTTSQWEESGLSGDGWVSNADITTPPAGCYGTVLDDIYTDSAWNADGIRHGWSSMASTDVPIGSDDDFGVTEAKEFRSCLVEAGYERDRLEDTDNLTDGSYWQERYFPESATETENGTEFRHSDVTEADRQRYFDTKEAEIDAAVSIAACDDATGYSAAVNARYEREVEDTYYDNYEDGQEYLGILNDTLDQLSE
ncbi:hypothetical protein [Haloglycomyces albus]|uniref:hypothetical protein n=1 Tax=Haloglycomyces albus TaxID=526067 RepID=UPI0004B88A09|nr:hypothetical protein [Haloglycomyces albus]